jgi:exopolysaccharide biosynthesis polyprenyl glycosylphosphotransferase
VRRVELLDERDETVRVDRWAALRRLPAPAWLRGEGTDARRAWQGSYVRRIALGDALVAAIASVVGYLARFGAETQSLRPTHPSLWMVALLPPVWVVVMLVARTYEQRFLWIGAEEFRRVFSAAVGLLAGVGAVSWAFQLQLARGFVVVALPLATGLTLLQRYLQRSRIHRLRSRGLFMQTAIIVGHRSGVMALHEQIDREAYHGYRVIGCCLPPAVAGDPAVFDGLPVLGTLDDVVDVVRRYEVDTVAVLPSPELDGPALRSLGWELEKTQAELLLAPAVTEIAGPRVRIRPVCGLPLLHMERPELRGVRRLTKDTFDRTAAAAGILLLLPLLLALAVSVGLTSRGGVFYRQERVGRDGQTFGMLKFRSMIAGADRLVEDLATQTDGGNAVLFKIKGDPRVTRIGKVLRRYSLDELPQLLNVVRGDMSLVGPRPPLPTEVERYGFDMHRRFLVKPGITGLWQVSGRSDLSWDDSVRIDVRYVENWSLAFDFMILWKTVGAVFRGAGAY